MTAPSGYESWSRLPKGVPATGEDGYVCAIHLFGQIRIVKDGVLVEGGWRRKALDQIFTTSNWHNRYDLEVYKP